MSRQNRRGFLKSSVAAASAVFAAPAILRAGMSPNEKLGVAIVGVNGRGGEHISSFLGDERTEIRAIVDVDEVVGAKRCDAIAEKQDHARNCSPICERRLKTRALILSALQLPITGTRSPVSGPCRRVKTPILKSQSVIMSGKDLL